MGRGPAVPLSLLGMFLTAGIPRSPPCCKSYIVLVNVARNHERCLFRMAVRRIDDKIDPVSPFRPFPQHLTDVSVHIGVVHRRTFPDAAPHALGQAEWFRIEQDDDTMLGEEMKFLLRHGIISAHRNHRLMVEAHSVDDFLFLGSERIRPRTLVVLGDAHPRVLFHHAVRIGQLPVQAVSENPRRAALSCPHGTDQNYISLFHRYLGFGRYGSPRRRTTVLPLFSMI